MKDLEETYREVNGLPCVVQLHHNIFGNQQFEVGQLQIICDGDRLGVRIMGQDIFVWYSEIKTVSMSDSLFRICSDMMEITIIVSKL